MSSTVMKLTVLASVVTTGINASFARLVCTMRAIMLYNANICFKL